MHCQLRRHTARLPCRRLRTRRAQSRRTLSWDSEWMLPRNHSKRRWTLARACLAHYCRSAQPNDPSPFPFWGLLVPRHLSARAQANPSILHIGHPGRPGRAAPATGSSTEVTMVTSRRPGRGRVPGRSGRAGFFFSPNPGRASDLDLGGGYGSQVAVRGARFSVLAARARIERRNCHCHCHADTAPAPPGQRARAFGPGAHATPSVVGHPQPGRVAPSPPS